MKMIPYGISNYKELINLDMYYIDKTKFIEILEKKARYQLFIRPRRFGKSLFLTMLETYYNLNEKDNFEHYFKGLYIGENKTKEANKYVILKLSFANVITDLGKEELIESFDRIVSGEIDSCIKKYQGIFKEKGLAQEERKATYALDFLKRLGKREGVKVFLLIDGYDIFANNIMTGKRKVYEELVQEGGYVRTFYKGIKEGTADGVITRTFITGVSPILLDDITSGANNFFFIAKDEDLNNMLGFTENEVKEILTYYKITDTVDEKDLYSILKNYCNGYRFNERAKDIIYNTDMVLYILMNIIEKGEYPQKFIDENMKTDYTRLRNIAENFVNREEMLKMIQGEELGPVEIKERFNLEGLYTGADRYTNIRSLLYYLGLLTIKEQRENALMLTVPNLTKKSLYWEYIYHTYQIEETSCYDNLKQAMSKMRKDGNIEMIMEIYTRVINKMSTRDLLYFNEVSCKSIFISLVYTDGIYLIASEREADGGFSDLYIKENVLFKEHLNYRYLIEFKYLKIEKLTGDINKLSKEEFFETNKKVIENIKLEGEEQLERYLKEKNILHDSSKTLKKLLVLVISRKYVDYYFLD